MPSILLVEDDGLVRESLLQALVGRGLNVRAVANGHEALAMLAGPRPSVLVTDIDLGPGPGGLEVSREARAAWSELRVVSISAHDLTECGVEGALFVAKPFDPDRLAQLINVRHADACAESRTALV